MLFRPVPEDNMIRIKNKMYFICFIIIADGICVHG